MKSQVTTHYGDGGMTRSLGGDRVPKSHPVMEAVGALDAFRAQLCLLRLALLEKPGGGHAAEAECLWWLLHVCFLMGAEISDPLKKHPEWRRGEVGGGHLKKLEAEQARLEGMTPLPRAFVVSAANTTAALADIAATSARTFERRLVALKEAEPGFDAEGLFAFVNRLSDYLFILARHLDGGEHQTVDYGAAAP